MDFFRGLPIWTASKGQWYHNFCPNHLSLVADLGWNEVMLPVFRPAVFAFQQKVPPSNSDSHPFSTISTPGKLAFRIHHIRPYNSILASKPSCDKLNWAPKNTLEDWHGTYKIAHLERNMIWTKPPWIHNIFHVNLQGCVSFLKKNMTLDIQTPTETEVCHLRNPTENIPKIYQTSGGTVDGANPAPVDNS